MKKYLFCACPLLIFLSGCSLAGGKVASLSMIYAAAAVLSLLLLIGCIVLVHKNKKWFLMLFSCVLIVNIGYTLLSLSSGLQEALWANRISYFGSVFLPFAMLMILLNITNTPFRRRLPTVLFVLSCIVFLIAASSGILDIYYKDVSFQIIDGVSRLVKVYGPLHPLYLFYLLGYFSAMVIVIIRASVKKSIDTTAHAVIIAIAVFVNIGVWFIEQISDIDFEMLSISYIISELFLLGVHIVMIEYQQLQELINAKETALQAAVRNDDHISDAETEHFIRGVSQLTNTEKQIYEAYLIGKSTKEIMQLHNITENTVKFHNKNIYGKLGVSSRKQLLAFYRAIEKSTGK